MGDKIHESIQFGLKVSYLLLSLLLFSTLITGCGDTPTDTTPDPSGTVTSQLRIQGYGDYSIDFETGSVGSGETDLYLDTQGNFCTMSNFGLVPLLVSVGSVSGVGDITSIPTAGWVNECSAIVGDGYLVKSINYVPPEAQLTGNIYRIYVDDYIISATSGGVIGFRIKWVLMED